MNLAKFCFGWLMTMTLVVSLAGQDPDAAPITAIGCVNRAAQSGSLGGNPGLPPAPPATAGVLANASDPTNVFLLNGATTPHANNATRARAAAGRRPDGVPTAYVLDGKPQDVEGHLGQRVEVTGTVLAPNEGGPEATKSNIKHIRVASIRMLALTCPIASTKPGRK